MKYRDQVASDIARDGSGLARLWTSVELSGLDRKRTFTAIAPGANRTLLSIAGSLID